MSVSTTAGLPGAQAYDQPTAGEDAHTILVNRVSWGAIFAGVVVGLVVQVLLTMLGVGIGVATLDPGAGDNPAVSTFSIATGLWYVLSGIIAAFAGGYIAARMSGKTVATTGALHGLTSWAFTTLLVLYLLSTAVGGIVGGRLQRHHQRGRRSWADGGSRRLLRSSPSPIRSMRSRTRYVRAATIRRR